MSLSRRAFLRAGLAGAGAALMPAAAAAQSAPDHGSDAASAGTLLVDPYEGAIPLVFPLRWGTYRAPLRDNWHVSRQGNSLPWSHLQGTGVRAHDGVDAYPIADQPLPTVYAPVQGTIAAVCLRSANTVDADLTYRVSRVTPPPWDYSGATDTVDLLPLYGNFVWLLSTEPDSRGYFLFLCHLQNEPIIQALAADQPVGVDTAIGVVGDTGNAVGTPQLHVEVHYPADFAFRCRRCQPETLVTGFSPYPSLARATLRS